MVKFHLTILIGTKQYIVVDRRCIIFKSNGQQLWLRSSMCLPPPNKTLLQKSLQFRYPTFEAPPADGYPTPPETIIRPLDAHVDDALILKRVVLLPDLAAELSELTENTVSSKVSIRDTLFGALGGIYDNTARVTDAAHVLRIHTMGYTAAGSQLASSCVFHPEEPDNHSVLRWLPLASLTPTWDEPEPNRFIVQDQVLGIHDDSDSLSPEVRKRMTSIQRHVRFGMLGVFLSSVADSDSLLRSMDDLVNGQKFPWELSTTSTASPPTPIVVRSNDAPSRVWSLPCTTGSESLTDATAAAATDTDSNIIYTKERRPVAASIEQYVQRVSFHHLLAI